MPNGVKYSTTIPSGSLKRGNVALGVNGNLGPTSTTGFYSMPAPQSGKYIINKVSPSGNPNFFAPANDAELIRLAQQEGAVGADTGSAAAVLAWMATQDNLEAVNIEYENIVTNGLVLNLDAGFVGSYPITGTTWYDLSGNSNNGTLINGPTFSSANSGSIVFDGIDDYTSCADSSTIDLDNTVGFTVSFFNYRTSTTSYQGYVGRGDNYGFQVYGDINAADARIEIAVVNGGYNSFINSGNNFYPLNTWSFTCMKYDAQNQVIIFYQNQNKYTFTSNVGGPGYYALSTTTPLFIGWANYAGRYFGGRLNNIMLYNRVLSDSEITQNYNAQKGRFGL